MSLMESTKSYNAVFDTDLDELSPQSSTHTLFNEVKDVRYEEFIAVSRVSVDRESSPAVHIFLLNTVVPNVEYNNDTILLPRGENTVAQRTPNRRGHELLSRIYRAKYNQHNNCVAILKRGSSIVEIATFVNIGKVYPVAASKTRLSSDNGWCHSIFLV